MDFEDNYEYESEIKPVNYHISVLVSYANAHLMLDWADTDYVTNQLLDLMHEKEPYYGDLDSNSSYLDSLNALVAHAVEIGLTTEEDKILFETRINGLLLPLPSVVTKKFFSEYKEVGPMAACRWLLTFETDCNYIRSADIIKNRSWSFCGKRGKINVTINLAKPEKDPKEVARAKLAKTGYPKCMLCPENVGFAGNAGHPARQNLRIIPLALNGEPWYMQFSPYVYFDQHVIVFSEEHRPMCLSKETFVRMFDFVDVFGHYFIGSNAPLPIVGGSILAHEHYQGGSKVLPMLSAPPLGYYVNDRYPAVEISVLNWYNSVVRLSSADREQLLTSIELIRNAWSAFSNPLIDVICATYDANGNLTEQHNTVTPICHKENEVYTVDLILRNNRTDEQHPFGIFHPAEPLHHIKKESIGIIEVMGTFILPGRLQGECSAISDILCGARPYDTVALCNKSNPLNKHKDMIDSLVAKYGKKLSKEKADKAVREYVNEACEQILETTAVFKHDKVGMEAFDEFLTDLGYHH